MCESIYKVWDIIEKVEIIQFESNDDNFNYDYDIVKIYEIYNEHEIKVDKHTGVKWVFENIINAGYTPKEVYVHDAKTIVLKYKLDV